MTGFDLARPGSDHLGMITINLKTRRQPLWQLREPPPWADRYGVLVLVEAGIISDVEEVLYYDDFDWDCSLDSGRGATRWCGPGALGFHSEAEEAEHFECGPIAFCETPNTYNDGCYELPFEWLRRWSPGDRTPRAPLVHGNCIYLVQIHPEAAPLEIKAGFSKNLAARVKTYRTGSPQAQVIAAKPGTMADESALLMALGRIGVPLSAEVFRVESVEDALEVFEGLKVDDQDLE